MARRVSIQLDMPDGAPRRPTKTALVRLFERAWRATPNRRRPPVSAELTLAVNLTWVDDDEIAALHARHFGTHEATDVVSFPMLDYDPEQEAFLLGEIAVSQETARREATARELPFEEELSRYALHGFLHLIGYRDKTPRQRAEMTQHQERILAAHFGQAGNIHHGVTETRRG